MKRTLSFVLSMLMLISALPFISPVSVAAEGDFTIVDGVLTKYNGSDSEVVVPDGVTEIGRKAFEGNLDITSVVIPSSVTIIRIRAFYGCTALQSVIIPSGVKTIENVVFAECVSLESAVLPNSVKSIGTWAFRNCKSLKSFVIPDSVTYIDSIFDGCTSLETIVIGNGLMYLGPWMFRNCESLISITIPSGIKEINSDAFFNCGSLVSMTFEREDTKINPRALDNTPPTMLIRGYSPSTAETFAKSKGYPFESIGEGTGAGQGTDVPSETETSQIIVPSDKADVSINLTLEEITLSGFNVAAYSTDGGNRWKKGALPTGAKFSKLFNKEMTLWLCSEVDKKKKPTEDAAFVKFPTINARPKSEKLKPFYNADNWVLVKRGSEDKITSGYEFAYTKDKRTATDNQWYSLNSNGFELKEGKTRVTYLIRSPAKNENGTYTPAGKIIKVTPANYGSAPKLKIDYKNKTLKIKNGYSYQTDGGENGTVAEKKFELDMADEIENGIGVYVWKSATGKKPPSQKQYIAPTTQS